MFLSVLYLICVAKAGTIFRSLASLDVGPATLRLKHSFPFGKGWARVPAPCWHAQGGVWPPECSASTVLRPWLRDCASRKQRGRRGISGRRKADWGTSWGLTGYALQKAGVKWAGTCSAGTLVWVGTCGYGPRQSFLHFNFRDIRLTRELLKSEAQCSVSLWFPWERAAIWDLLSKILIACVIIPPAVTKLSRHSPHADVHTVRQRPYHEVSYPAPAPISSLSPGNCSFLSSSKTLYKQKYIAYNR